MLRGVCVALFATAAAAQQPEVFFRDKGADFRGTAPETRLYWRPHVQHSHRRILEAAERAAGREVAIVLGCGAGTEIPLAALAARFRRLILVDLDGPSMVQALEQVPLALRPGVELRVMDVTSFVGPLMERLRREVEASASPDESFQRIGAVLDSLELGPPLTALPEADLVVSSLLLSEIPRLPLTYAGRLVRARFGVELLDAWPGADAAFARLVSLSIADHARLLGALLRSGGAAYYSDTFARGPAYARVGPEVQAGVDASLLRDFRRLGLAGSAEEVAGAVRGLCVATHPIEKEVEALEALLAAWYGAGPEAFEPLLPAAELQGAFADRGFVLRGSPESWWWLSYPCVIAGGPGAFYVNSLILQQGDGP